MTRNEPLLPGPQDADLPDLGDAQVESLLRGHRPGDAAPGTDRTADVLHALAGPATPGELTGHRQAMAAYADAFPPRASGRPRRLVLLSSLVGARALAGAAGAALAAGAVGAVVLASTTLGPTHDPEALPLGTGSTTSTTTATHPSDDAGEDDADEAGAPTRTGSATAGVGPDAKGPAAHGLCNAWSHHQAKGRTTAPGRSVAFRNLAAAAGGTDKIAAYCATVPHPGGSDSGDAGDDAKEGTKPSKAAKTKPAKTKPAQPTQPAQPAKPAKPGRTGLPETSSSVRTTTSGG